MTTSATSASSRRRLLIVAGLSLASGVAASAASDRQSPLHRPPALPSGHFSSSAPRARNCANYRYRSSNADRRHQQHSRLLLSKALFFSGQPVLSFMAAQSRHGGNTRSSPPAPASYEIPRGGVSSAGRSPAAMPLIALLQDMVSVGAATLVGAALTFGERVFDLFGWEAPAMFRRGAKDGSDIFGSSSNTAIAAAPAVPYATVGFAAASTIIGACLVLAAVAVLSINPANAMSFFVFDGLAIAVTLIGILVTETRLDFVNMLATRGVLPMSVLLGLLGFLGIYT